MWKKEHPFLAEAPSQTLSRPLKALAKAIQEAFDKANPKRLPVFKKRGQCKDKFSGIYRALRSATIESSWP